MIREFRLSPRDQQAGVSCDENGAFVGDIPLLTRSSANGKDHWRPIDSKQLSEMIGSRFGFPIDMTRKIGGLTVIAKALNAGDIARAQIAALLFGIPDPPQFSKTANSRDAMIKFIRDLHWSGLIKADWDSDKHPRWPAGSPDSQGGQFAPKGDGTAGEVSDPGSTSTERDRIPTPLSPVAATPPGRHQPKSAGSKVGGRMRQTIRIRSVCL